VTGVYAHPERDLLWVIDDRIDDLVDNGHR
jgi:hypothetical protein